MNEQYGEFGKNIIALDNALEQVKTVWMDETAKSYDALNENVKICAEKIWALFSDSKAGTEAVKKNYSPDEVDKELAKFGMRIEQV